jgi:polyadenylate-binding protein
MNYGTVKSLKVSLNPDHSSRGYGFIQFEDEDSARTAVHSLQHEKILQAFVFKPRDKRELRRLVNNIYVKNLPKQMSKD